MHAPDAPLPAAGGPGAPVPFRWSDVAIEHRDWLRQRTEEVVGLAYRQACDVVRMGALLVEVKRTVGHGAFVAWVAAQLPFTVQHGRRMMRVARAFGAYQKEQFVRFAPSALYVLAQPQGVKPEARAHAVQLAEAGENITHAKALEIIDAHRPKVSGAELKADMTALARRMAPIRGAEKDQREQAAKQADSPEETQKRMAELGAALAALADECSVIHVTKIDEEEGDEPPLYSVTTYRENDAPRNTIGRKLLDTLLAAAGAEPKKACPTCRELKPLSQFADRRGTPDGRDRCCRACERPRIAAVKQKRRAGAAPPAS